ncbi:leucyl/phenylalanyl-tRNA--protein transferase [Paracoccus aestuariivivens]|uniref:Leucyl/phenylalanyl-tRNA--protein transferase n=1 Tax=Paracoccus aestuariivivens TaxID=1820333 RepID=A0A6L6JGZ6_9RHOB|nr:leucyl/phenylalanyl-tRNA--protein transferase [Paracoccus aestuariivivens]MTH79837.1 leucyl/phenylalanyl-tRNA--protein transferase [Paracoccus aestuariivivens]
MTLLTAERLLQAYAQGVFPMAESALDTQLYWFDPPERGVLPVGGVHISRSMRRFLRKSNWRASINQDFSGVIAGCADREETWINGPLIDLYMQLFRMGNAHSLEIYEGDELIGGTYGISLGGAFFGESMFSRRTNASKAALIWMSYQLKRTGFRLWDTQYRTEHLVSMGGYSIPRSAYRRALLRAIMIDAKFTATPLPDLQLLLQDMTQTS